MTIRVSLFDSVQARSIEERWLTLPEIAELLEGTQAAEKALLPLLKLAMFGDYRTRKGSLRCDRNMHFISGCELDYDGGIVSFADAVAIAEKQPLRCLLYTSPSHSPERPRWRLLAPTSGEYPAQDRKRFVERINGVFNGIFSSESWTASQSFFFGRLTTNPHFEIVLVDGEFVDQLHDLDLIARGKAAIGRSGNGHAFEGGTAGFTEAQLAELIRSGAHYHEPTLRLATIWARRGVDQSETEDDLADLFDEVPPEQQDRERWGLRRGEVRRCVADMYLNVAREAEEQEERRAAGLIDLEARTGIDVESDQPLRGNGHDPDAGALPAEPYSASTTGFVADDFHTDTRWATPAPAAEPWPEMASEAFYGLPGQVVDTIAPETEADPVALLMMFLAEAGNQIGRGPFFQVGSKRHHLNLNEVLVGETAKARKGTAAAETQPVLELADEKWQIQTGLSSGEGVIYAVHDEVRVREKVSVKDQKPQYVEVVKEENVADKRLMIIEEEFGGALEVMQREGSILSRVLRDAWDGRKLATMTKHSPTRATGAHVSIVGHITVDELRDKLDRVSMFNGYANRFLFACVRRAQLLPFGGEVDPAALDRFSHRLREIREAAGPRGALARRITFHALTRPIWEAEYALLSVAQPGLLGAVTARAEAQTARLATLYAVLDFSANIEPKHLAAALAVWRYCEASAKYIFGDATGNPIADEILRALRQPGTDGMTRTQISEIFGRNRGADQIGAALAFLLSCGKARSLTRPRAGGGPGRGVEVWLAC